MASAWHPPPVATPEPDPFGATPPIPHRKTQCNPAPNPTPCSTGGGVRQGGKNLDNWGGSLLLRRSALSLAVIRSALHCDSSLDTLCLWSTVISSITIPSFLQATAGAVAGSRERVGGCAALRPLRCRRWFSLSLSLSLFLYFSLSLSLSLPLSPPFSLFLSAPRYHPLVLDLDIIPFLG